uniref:Uncharacterized protein n=1 Tax=Caenorhabditis tropicalis TaxID=1561998 RepID=A0A1I7TCL1_9PELO
MHPYSFPPQTPPIFAAFLRGASKSQSRLPMEKSAARSTGEARRGDIKVYVCRYVSDMCGKHGERAPWKTVFRMEGRPAN